MAGGAPAPDRGVPERQTGVAVRDPAIPRAGSVGALCRRLLAPEGRADAATLVIAAAVAVAVRVPLFPFLSEDVLSLLGPWFDYVVANGHFSALSDSFSSYSPPYLYLLALASYAPVGARTAIKTIAVLSDMALAVAFYALVGAVTGSARRALIGAVVVLFLPTVLVNGALWGRAMPSTPRCCSPWWPAS